MRQAIRKVKVLGYPFAGGQGRGGVELTPGWMKSQTWFKTLAASRNVPVEYEEIQVSSPLPNSAHAENLMDEDGHIEAKNIDHVMASSEQLKR
jgi:arginase